MAYNHRPTTITPTTHRRNRSLSAAAPPNIGQHPQSQSQPPQPQEFIPSRNAPEPPSSRRLAPSSSLPYQPANNNNNHNYNHNHHTNANDTGLRSYGRFNDQFPIQGETVSSPGTLMTPYTEPKKTTKSNKTGGFGKLLKKLGNKNHHHHQQSQYQSDRHHPIVTSSPPSLPPVIPSTTTSTSSSTSGVSSSYHQQPQPPTSPKSPKQNPYSIPLAPPAPAPPKIPSIEVGQRTYLKPELKKGLQESDNLLSSIPAELRSKPPQPARIVEGPPLSMYNLPPPPPQKQQQQQQQQQQSYQQTPIPSSTLPSTTISTTTHPNTRNNNNKNNNNNKANYYKNQQLQPQQTNVFSSSNNGQNNVNYNLSIQLPPPSQQPLRGILQKPPPPEITTIPASNTNNNNSVTSLPQVNKRLDEDEDEAYESSSIKPQRFSTWSYASTGKSSGTYSLYSTFGPESRPSSESAFDLQNENDSGHSSDEDGEGVTISKQHSNGEENEPVIAAVGAATSVTTTSTAAVTVNDHVSNPTSTSTTPSANNDKMDEINNDFTTTYNNTNEISDDDSDSSSDDDDLFVDATGMSQEDIEREKNERRRLSKRLSGGHFGSAGGLMLSIGSGATTLQQQEPPPPVPSLPSSPKLRQNQKQRRPSEDLVQAMLEWKRHSGSAKIEVPFIPPASSLPPPPRPVRKRPEQSSPAAPTQQEQQPQQNAPQEQEKENGPLEQMDDARKAAQRIWDHDETFVPREKAAEWLGQAKPFHAKALVYYMSHFEFMNMLLDKAFRKLCSKLYFKAEAQQIDRILEAFARRYWRCNPQCIFGSADIVYAVVYSLLLLNTDLHVVQGNHARMNRQAFVRNTMSTIRDQVQSLPPEKHDRTGQLFTKAWETDIEVYLKELYVSVKHSQILQPLEQEPHPQQQQQQNQLSVNNVVEKRASMLGGKMVEFTRSVNTIIRNKSGRESALIHPATPTTVTTDELSLHNKHVTSNPSSPIGSPRRGSFSSSLSSASLASSAARMNNNTNGNTLSPHQPMMSFIQSHASDLFTSRPPYLKEGVVVRKHLLENGRQKAKHREWRECFLVVGHGELKMYAMQGSTGEERRSMLRVNSFTTLADSLQGSSKPGMGASTAWASSMQQLGTVTLNHSLSNILPPPGYNRQRPHVFAIQQSHGGVFLFQASSQEQVNEWVETCNYWAARQSKEPLAGGVSNMEYGWGACLNDVILDLDALDISGKYLGDPDALSIYDWRPPAPPTVCSTLDEQEQWDALQKHLDALSDEINEHRELKRKILVKFPSKSQNHTKVMANWEAKSNYLLHEIIKYQNYCDALERSVKRRQQQKKQQQEKQQQQQIQQQKQHQHQKLPSISIEQANEMDLFGEIQKQLKTGF